MQALPPLSCLPILAGALASCSTSAVPEQQTFVSRRGQLREIAAQCGLPARALSLNDGGDIRFRPQPGTRYEVVDCALVQLRKRGLDEHMPMGFVGNATPGEEDGNNASPN